MKLKLTRNMGLKLLSLIVAFLIWLLVANMDDPTRTILIRDVKIQTENVDSVTAIDKTFSIIEDDIYSDTVVIRVTERNSVLKHLSKDDFKVIADMEILNDMGAVPLRVECSNSAVTQDEMEVIPSAMKVELEQKKQSEFAVNVVTTGKPEKGYEVGTTTVVQGKTIQIAGPESLLNKIGQVVASVNVKGMKTDQRLTGSLHIYDKNGDEFVSQLEQLQLKDSTGALLAENELMIDVKLWKVMNDIPVEVETTGTPADGYHITGVTTVPVTVNLVGTDEALARLNGKIVVSEPISVEGASANISETIDLTETLSTIDEIRLVADVEPTISVTVQIEKSGDQTVEVPLSNLEVLNRPDTTRMSLTFSPADVIKVGIHAETASQEALGLSDIIATVDLGECSEEGTYDIPVHIELPEGYTLVSDVILKVTATANDAEDAETANTEG